MHKIFRLNIFWFHSLSSFWSNFGMTNRGVSGSDKTNETEISDLVWFGLKPIQTNRNCSSLVWFIWLFISRSVKPMNQSDENHASYFTNIILPHTNLWLDSKLKSNMKYFLIHSRFLIFIPSHQSDSFISTKKNSSHQPNWLFITTGQPWDRSSLGLFMMFMPLIYTHY